MPNSKEMRNVETLETLAGERKGAVPKAAVRIEDLNGLLKLPDKLQSAKAVGGTPTKDEYDALVEDVHAIHRSLKATMRALRDRLV